MFSQLAQLSPDLSLTLTGLHFHSETPSLEFLKTWICISTPIWQPAPLIYSSSALNWTAMPLCGLAGRFIVQVAFLCIAAASALPLASRGRAWELVIWKPVSVRLVFRSCLSGFNIVSQAARLSSFFFSLPLTKQDSLSLIVRQLRCWILRLHSKPLPRPPFPQ